MGGSPWRMRFGHLHFNNDTEGMLEASLPYNPVGVEMDLAAKEYYAIVVDVPCRRYPRVDVNSMVRVLMCLTPAEALGAVPVSWSGFASGLLGCITLSFRPHSSRVECTLKFGGE